MRTMQVIAAIIVGAGIAAADTTYTNAWAVDLPRNPPAVIDLWRGETVALCARTGITNLPASAEFLWQSPSMGTSWYTTNATATVSGDVTAVWRPEMDSGAASYAFFFRVGNGDLYRPRGTIKMQGSPGATPNAIPIPPRTLDFATVVVANAPWATPDDVTAATTGVLRVELDPEAAAWQTHHLSEPNPHGITPEAIEALPDAWPATGTVSRAIITGTENTWVSADDGSAALNYPGRIAGTRGSADQIIVSGVDGEGYNGPAAGTVFSFSSWEAPYSTYTSGVWRLFVSEAFAGTVYLDRDPDPLVWLAVGKIPVGGHIDIEPDELDEEAVGTVSLSWYGVGVISDPIALRSDVDYAMASIEAGVSNAAHDVATTLIGHPMVLQGSTVVPATNVALSVSGVASNGVGGAIHLMPWQATRPSEAGSTGTLHVATAPDTYIVDVSGDIAVTPLGGQMLPMTWDPVEWRSERVSETNWIVYAWAPGSTQTYDPAPGAGYYATLSNLVVSTYSRPGYRPGALTNDTAALPLYADTPDVARAPGRLVATAGGVRSYVDSRKAEIAKAAWRYTPRGLLAPSSATVTLDLPLVQQGQIGHLQVGDYFVFSYDGGDWISNSEGSRWQIGASGRSDFAITSESRMAHIRDFAVDNLAGIATIYASTNWMDSLSDPYVEFNLLLETPQWLACQNCTRSYHVDPVNGDYWMFTAPATEPKMFFRVLIPGGERRIISTPTHRFEGGVEFGDAIYNIITITNGPEVIEVVGRRLP